MENNELIVNFFKAADKPVSAGQIATATGIDRKEVDKVMKQLKKEEAIVSPKACYWEIKK